MTNPFIFGNPVRGEAFFGRKRELRRLVETISKGNSAALTSEPRLGKTSLLFRIQDPELYGEKANHLHFCYLDAQTLNGWTVTRFWQTVLQPFKTLESVHDAYNSAALEGFGTFLLERFFMQLEEADERLVILLDEFDLILEEPGLNKAEFYGGLRALATRFSSLSLILSSRQLVEELNRRTQEYSRLGSPYFNFFAETSLGVFSERESSELLALAQGLFSREDRLFLMRISGGYPYFLQSAAYYLWEAYMDGHNDSRIRREVTAAQCFHHAASVMRDTWRIWSPYQQMAFTLAVLDEMPRLLSGREIDINQLFRDQPNFAPEQRILKQRGFLCEDKTLQGGYAPQAEVMVWFLAEELIRLLRPNNPDIASWLRDQQWEGLLKRSEKETLKKTLLTLKPMLRDGVQTFIRAAAEGISARMM